MPEQLIILTCNVQPDKSVQVRRNEAQMRLDDYEKSIKKWIKVARDTSSKILVLENSGNLDKIKNRIESSAYQHMYFFETSLDVTSGKKGISAGEFAMLREAIPFILDIPGINFCWKVTGRLYVENFKQISKVSKEQVYVNRFYNPLHIVDSRFIGFPKEVFLGIFSKEPEFGIRKPDQQIDLNPLDISSLEELLTISLTSLECAGLKVTAMRKIPIFTGSSASTNKKLDSSLLTLRLKFHNLVRPIATKLLGGSSP